MTDQTAREATCRYCGHDIIFEPWFRDGRQPNEPVWSHVRSGTKTCSTRPVGWNADAWPFAAPASRDVEVVVAGIRDAARTASGQQPQTKPAYYGVNGCTCRAWTGDGGVPRFLRGDESVELISGWEEQPDCPHHAPAASGQQPEATRVGRCPVMFQGGGRCEKDADHRAGRWPDDPHTPEPASAVGQPTEAHTTDASLTAAERKFLHFALDEAAEEMSYGDGFTDEDQAALDRLRLLAGKDER